MTSSSTRSIRTLLVLCGSISLTSAVLFWTAYAAQRAAFRHNTEARTQATPRAFTLNGLLFRLDKYASPGVEGRLSDARYLVFVTSDSCDVSRAQLPRWRVLLRRMAFKPADRVLLVSMDGRDLPRQLEPTLMSIGVAYQFLTVSNSAGFMRETGISATPWVLALDHDLRVRLSDIQQIPAVSDEIMRFFGSRSN